LEGGLYELCPEGEPAHGGSLLTPTEEAMAGIWGRVLETPAESLSPESHFAELGGDSLSLFDLAAAIEEEFGVSVETSELRDTLSLEDAALLVERLRGKLYN
jgi:acyl carrier protein